MGHLTKILVATDFSRICDNALQHAVSLARSCDAQLHILHTRVVHTNLISPEPFGDDQDYTGRALEKLERLTTGMDIRPITEVRKGAQAARVILDYAREIDADLVVMGTHARRKVRRFFMGSVAAEVLRLSKLSVLVVGSDHDMPAGGYQGLVLPVDLAEQPTMLKQRASALPLGDNPLLRCIHVFETDHLRHVYSDLRADGKQRAVDRLDQLVKQAELPGQTRQQVVTGAADEQVANSARDAEIDLIVMGRTSVSRMGQVLVGSTTDRVVRQAPCPVLVWSSQQDRDD